MYIIYFDVTVQEVFLTSELTSVMWLGVESMHASELS